MARDHGAVMLPDEFPDTAWETEFFGEVQPVGDMLYDDRCRRFRLESFVRIFKPGRLVFYEEEGILGFSDVVVEGPNSREESIRANSLRGLLGQICDLEAVLVCPGRGSQEVLEQGIIRPGELQEAQRCDQAQDRCDDEGDQEGNSRRGDPFKTRRPAV